MTTLVHPPVASRRRVAALFLPIAAAVTLVAAYMVAAATADRVAPTLDQVADRPSIVGAAQALPPNDWLAEVWQNGASSRIEFSQLSTGKHRANLHVGFGVMAVARRSANEILVSDVIADYPDGRGAPHPRLWILDGSSLAVKAGPIAMPSRVMYTLYATGMVLSSDERYLYYLRHVECGPGCDDYRVAIVDLNTRSESAAANLPRNCGFAELLRTGTTNVTALCPEFASVWRVDADGSATELSRFTIANDHPVHGGITTRGETFVLTQKGRLLVKDAAGTMSVDRAVVSAPQRLSGLDRLATGDQRDVLGVSLSADRGLSGLLLIDRTNWSTRVVDVPMGAKHMTAAGDGLVAVAGASGVVLASNVDGSMTAVPKVRGLMPDWSFTSGTN